MFLFFFPPSNGGNCVQTVRNPSVTLPTRSCPTWNSPIRVTKFISKRFLTMFTRTGVARRLPKFIRNDSIDFTIDAIYMYTFDIYSIRIFAWNFRYYKLKREREKKKKWKSSENGKRYVWRMRMLILLQFQKRKYLLCAFLTLRRRNFED